MTWSDLGVMWEGGTGCDHPIQGVNSTRNPMFKSVLNGFRSKHAPCNTSYTYM